MLLDLSIEPDETDGDWAVFVQDADGNYLADVLIDPTIDYDELAHKLAELVDAVTRGERPKLVHW